MGNPHLKPDSRMVAEVLMRRGHYAETKDAGEWVQVDAERIVEFTTGACDVVGAVRRAILDTGLHSDNVDEIGCLDGDVAAICDAIGATA